LDGQAGGVSSRAEAPYAGHFRKALSVKPFSHGGCRDSSFYDIGQDNLYKSNRMKKLSVELILFTIALGLFSCGKDNPRTPRGTYTGTFTATYPSGPQVGSTSLELKNGRFSCSGNTDRIPAGGSGTYSIDDDKIIFDDENAWTTDFDGNLILSGAYDYTIDGDRLNFSKSSASAVRYSYDLERQ
jgi:hypothetical protein